MTMATQPAQAQQPMREEERVLGITYDRALAMVPELVRRTTGVEPEELGDGYLVAKVTKDGRTRDLTLRLGRQGADTRFSLRVESYAVTRYTVIFMLIAILTMGIGVLAALPWFMKMQRTEARERELLIHRLFRAIEDAVAEQGAAPNYRVAPGAGAPRVEEPRDAADAAEEPEGLERAEARRT